jgi:hypothetical protein
MDLLEIAQKFAESPANCTAEEVAQLAREFNLCHPNADQLLPIGNAYPGKWDGLQAAIAQAHYERQNLEALSANPFASPAEIAALPQPSPLAELDQKTLGKMIFGG